MINSNLLIPMKNKQGLLYIFNRRKFNKKQVLGGKYVN